METAARILVLAGIGNLAFGYLFGLAVSRTQLVDADSDEAAVSDLHTPSLIQGVMLLGLILAVQMSPIRARLESGAAILLALGSLSQAIAAIIAWRNGYPSPLSVRGSSYQAAAVGIALSVLGLVILTAGVLKGF